MKNYFLLSYIKEIKVIKFNYIIYFIIIIEISKSKKEQEKEIANKIENAKDIENDINTELKFGKENDENIKKKIL